MKACTFLVGFSAALSSAASAAAPQTSAPAGAVPVEVGVITPANWGHAQYPNDIDHYEPLPAAIEGRRGHVACNVLVSQEQTTEAWSQDQVDNQLVTLASRFTKESFSLPGATFTTVSQDEVQLSEHKAVLLISKGKLASPPSSSWSALTFYALPGWDCIAICTAGDSTDEAAAVAWSAWKPVLLPIVKSLNVQYHH